MYDRLKTEIEGFFEAPFYCAYNFPAVLVTLGPSHWSTSLCPLYSKLIKDPGWKVRRTLAFSLHEVARIIGPDLTYQDLIEVLYYFINDIEEVKIGVISNLSKFLSILTSDQIEKEAKKLVTTLISNGDA